MSNVELYEALRGSIPEAAARVIAEHFRPARDLATSSDLERLRSEMQAGFARLEGEIKAVARLQQWTLGFFVPLWVGTFGTIVAVVLKG